MRFKYLDALEDIAENIAFVRSYGGRLNAADLEANRELFYAVTRALEIISEASRQLPLDLTGRHPDVPWHQIRAAGNIYRHEYRGMLVNYVLMAATTGLDRLEVVIDQEIRAIKDRALP